ncbi:10703_t:CDS:2, partial [Racocetra persica]
SHSVPGVAHTLNTGSSSHSVPEVAHTQYWEFGIVPGVAHAQYWEFGIGE